MSATVDRGAGNPPGPAPTGTQSEPAPRTMRYTPLELDQMRTAIRKIIEIEGESTDFSADIERQLVTYMANGSTVEDLESHLAEKRAELDRKQQWWEAERDIFRRLCQHADWFTPDINDYYWGWPHRYSRGLQCRVCGQTNRRKVDRAASKPSPEKSPAENGAPRETKRRKRLFR